MKKVTLYYAVNSARSSGELLTVCAEHYSGEHGFTVCREQGKKPYFMDHPELHFSVSHSGRIWVCAFDSEEVGCDIQVHKLLPRYKKLAERWFHPNENAKVGCERDFFDIWSRKEAFVKAAGWGIDEKFKNFDSTSAQVSLNGVTFTLHDLTLPQDISEVHSAALACYDDAVVEYISFDALG